MMGDRKQEKRDYLAWIYEEESLRGNTLPVFLQPRCNSFKIIIQITITQIIITCTFSSSSSFFFFFLGGRGGEGLRDIRVCDLFLKTSLFTNSNCFWCHNYISSVESQKAIIIMQ